MTDLKISAITFVVGAAAFHFFPQMTEELVIAVAGAWVFSIVEHQK